ncbi:aspartate aminotransferase family protein [Zavarzinella formosa]|uniref:aspartate aminotransferase family protein n=1 Tax=Zavarzinella formosa TaxID=360055 RepID=UPI0002F0E2F1|nr:aspartate aminotransferase family protein [Zavarzinella formosa]
MTSTDVISQFQRYVIGNYTRYPVCLSRGEGSQVWDIEGNRYLDFFPGWGCGLLGHCPPRVVKAVQDQVAKLIHVPNTWYTESQGALGEALSTRTTFDGRAFFCNSGAEANEAAIKLARLNGRGSGSNGGDRYKIITMLNSFHGRTMGALSATAQPKYHAGVGPMLPGFNYAPFGDLDAVSQAVDAETIGIMVEPIQGEGGVNLPPEGYLEGLRELCDRYKLLLIFDEVQTGMGRTGKWFTHQHWNVKPDIITLAKAVGGGVAVGGLLARPEVAEKLKPGTHAATFGGNPIACAAALATIETIDQDGLLKRATHVGEQFAARFNALAEKSHLIREVRVKGAMIGVELATDGAPVVAECLKRKLLINATHQTVIRLLPALNITDAEINEGCDIIDEVVLAMK